MVLLAAVAETLEVVGLRAKLSVNSVLKWSVLNNNDSYIFYESGREWQVNSLIQKSHLLGKTIRNN